VRAVLRAYFQLDEHPEVSAVAEVAVEPAAGEPVDSARARQLVTSTRSVPEAVERLEAELLVDFEQGRLTPVAGWQLARLEAELLTLVWATGA